MKLLSLASVTAFSLQACSPSLFSATEIGEYNGTTLYEGSCSVNVGAVGKRSNGLFSNGEILSPYYSCEGRMKRTCSNGWTVHDIEKGAPERMQDRTYYSSGALQSIHNYIGQRVTVQYTCNG